MNTYGRRRSTVLLYRYVLGKCNSWEILGKCNSWEILCRSCFWPWIQSNIIILGCSNIQGFGLARFGRVRIHCSLVRLFTNSMHSGVKYEALSLNPLYYC